MLIILLMLSVASAKEADLMKMFYTLSEEIEKLHWDINDMKSELSQLKSVQNQYVGFTAYPSEDMKTEEGQKIIFNRELTDYGGHYSTSTGEFTCPITGLYFFSVSVMTYTGEHVAPQIMINNNGYVAGTAGGMEWNNASTTLIIQCSEGSRVWIKSTDKSDYLVSTVVSNDIQSSFSGFLISPLISPKTE